MNILFYGGHYWDRGPWFRKQQFASRLSERGHKVFYIEDTPSIIRKTKNHKNHYLKTTVKKLNDNLFIITPSAMFPFPKNFNIGKLYNLKLLRDLKKIFKLNNVKESIIWVNRIEFSNVFDSIKGKKIIDICDDLPYYQKLAGDEKAYKNIFRFFELAFKKSDIQIVSAVKLKEKYSYLTPNEIIVIPNGHNLSSTESDTLKIPEDINGIKRPIIGFIGTLFRFIDEDLLKYIIAQRPQYNYVFIGKKESNFPIEKINKYNNVHLLGAKPKNEIASYINSFDLCINPFKVHEVNDSVNPVKVFEYLSLKKPIVSSKMYSLEKERIAKYIHFANDYQEFLFMIDQIIAQHKSVNNVPDEEINLYHWDNLFIKLLNEIKRNSKIEL